VYNEAGEAVRHLYTYIDDPTNTLLRGVELSSTFMEPGSVSPALPGSIGIANDQGVIIAVWDGRGDSGSIVTNGMYNIEIAATDGQGGETDIVKQVFVIGRPGGGTEVAASPNIVDPAQPWVVFGGGGTPGLTVSVGIYDVAGELVTQVKGATGSGQAQWNSTGIASGLYLAEVTLTDANGKWAGRQVLKVLVRR
jgi:hypothetical protein